MSRIFPTVLLILGLLCPPAAPADSESAPGRPTVGLVLSGGGARGLAHVGVLRVLDEMRIPIDVVAGTSMGAVVGGLYASGMTAADLERLVHSVDWDAAFRDRPPRNDLSYRRKQDSREFLVRVPLGVRGGRLRFPRGLIQGQKLTQILRRETISVAGISDFDQLPTRFRALATDIETGERRVLGHGDLTGAIRASMSAPGVFAPVEVDGRLLVDGGLVENLPVDVAKELGVDVVIAVDVGFQPVGRRQLNSALAVSNQMISIMMARDTLRQRALLGEGDVLIEPALAGKSSVDFSDSESTIATGVAAARARRDGLAALAVGEAEWQRYIAARAAREPALPQIRFVRADPQSGRYSRRIEGALAPVIGQTLDAPILEQSLSRLYGDDVFETLDYRIVEEGGEQGLEVAATRKSWGPNFVRFGLELQDDLEGSNSFNAGVRLLVTDANRYGAEVQLDLRIGESPRLYAEFYQPVGYASPWFVAPRALIERRNFDLIEDDRRLASYRVRNREVGFDIGRQLGNWGELRAGLLRGTSSQLLRVGNPGDPGLPQTGEIERGEIYTRFSLDRLDDVYFPRHGDSFSLQWNGAREGLGSDVASNRIAADWLMARSRGRNTLVLWASGGSIVSGPQDVLQEFFPLGGLFNLSGLAPDALSGPHFGIARAIYYRRIGSGGEGFLDVPTYAGVSLELGNVWSRRSDIDSGSARVNGSAFLGFDTFLGPVYLATGFDDTGRSAFYLLLGRIR